MKNMIKMMAAVAVFAMMAVVMPLESKASSSIKSLIVNETGIAKILIETTISPTAKVTTPLRNCQKVTEIEISFSEGDVYYNGVLHHWECTGVSIKGHDANCNPIQTEIEWDCIIYQVYQA
jgi:hypothetical protein